MPRGYRVERATITTRPVRVVHSSDLHLGMDEVRHGLAVLEVVLHTARSLEADLLLLVGDVFDHNRVAFEMLDRTADVLAAAGLPTVILPGNHDSLSPGSVYHRGRFAQLEDIHVLGVTSREGAVEDAARFPHLDLEVWGRAHLDHFDMTPLRDPRPRSTRWQIAAAHGHWVTGPHDEHRAYLIREHDLRATAADYIALGHWDRWAAVGDGTIPAYYSGSPVYSKSVNLIEFGGLEPVRVERVPIEE